MIVIIQNIIILARLKRLENIFKQIAVTKNTDELSRKLDVITAGFPSPFCKNIFNE
jgi:hypothetical protein